MATISEALAIAIQHHQGGRLQAAEQIYRQILDAEPNQADAIHLLGLIAHQVGKHGIALEYIGRAIELKGNEATFHSDLAGVYVGLRRLPEAVACYRRALELKPDYAWVHSNLLYTRVFCPGYDAQAIFEEHRRWSRQHGSSSPIPTTALSTAGCGLAMFRRTFATMLSLFSQYLCSLHTTIRASRSFAMPT